MRPAGRRRFVAFAPDLHHGKIAATPAEAEQILAERDFPAVRATAIADLDFLRRSLIAYISGKWVKGEQMALSGAWASFRLSAGSKPPKHRFPRQRAPSAGCYPQAASCL